MALGDGVCDIFVVGVVDALDCRELTAPAFISTRRRLYDAVREDLWQCVRHHNVSFNQVDADLVAASSLESVFRFARAAVSDRATAVLAWLRCSPPTSNTQPPSYAPFAPTAGVERFDAWIVSSTLRAYFHSSSAFQRVRRILSEYNPRLWHHPASSHLAAVLHCDAIPGTELNSEARLTLISLLESGGVPAGRGPSPEADVTIEGAVSARRSHRRSGAPPRVDRPLVIHVSQSDLRRFVAEQSQRLSATSPPVDVTVEGLVERNTAEGRKEPSESLSAPRRASVAPRLSPREVIDLRSPATSTMATPPIAAVKRSPVPSRRHRDASEGAPRSATSPSRIKTPSIADLQRTPMSGSQSPAMKAFSRRSQQMLAPPPTAVAPQREKDVPTRGASSASAAPADGGFSAHRHDQALKAFASRPSLTGPAVAAAPPGGVSTNSTSNAVAPAKSTAAPSTWVAAGRSVSGREGDDARPAVVHDVVYYDHPPTGKLFPFAKEQAGDASARTPRTILRL